MSPNDKKRFFWLKLNKDFFDRHQIKVIEGMPNGKEYVLIYLKLLCEATSHDGKLRFSDTIPYNEIMLSSITNSNVDVLRSAIKIFQELNLMEVWDDGTLYMNEVTKMIGSETGQTIRKRIAQEVNGGNKVVKITQENRDKSIENRYILNTISFELPLKDGTLARITEEEVNHYVELYKDLDVVTELKKMQAWLEANPNNRKTKTGIKRFIVNWLNKSLTQSTKADKSQKKVPEWLQTYEDHFDEDIEDL